MLFIPSLSAQRAVQDEEIPFNAWTFGICTNGKTSPIIIRGMIRSIRALNIPCFEIIFATENPHFILSEPNVRVLYIQTNLPAHITLKKNRIAEEALYPNLCLMHDYIVLDKEWFKEFNAFGYDWTVCSSPFILPNGHRWWDWCTHRGPRGHAMAPYSELADENHYVPGMYFCVKKEFLLQYPLDERRVWNQGEDIEWSMRICDHWKYLFNPKAIARSIKIK